jgi:hypothetical protein
MRNHILVLLVLACSLQSANSQGAESTYDPKLAASVGADEHGMRNYVLVILKTGPKKVPAGPARDEGVRRRSS